MTSAAAMVWGSFIFIFLNVHNLIKLNKHKTTQIKYFYDNLRKSKNEQNLNPLTLLGCAGSNNV